ncbi:hypothetical protein FGG08_002050 [Glutinoglossum americanum]|uniref:Uncharacterized protein n=1 Tax=Glutinoglossum americanum TaxID=1670608 RepID=A0A9P8I5K0_9PEZI|nr:hypothetical protein FGG08_002050 [Glutinoglossum americanum]
MVVETATKNDKPSHARSAIRRHRVRGNPYAASAYRLSNGAASQGSEATLSPRRSLLFEVIRRPHRRISLSEDDSSSESDMELDAIAHAADLARLEASNRRRTENGRALLRDALSYERSGRRLRDRPSDFSRNMPPPLPPVPESRDYARRQPWELAIERARLEELYRRRGRMASPAFVPTPPYTPGSGDSSARSSPHSQAITPPLGSAALTPGFPPAHRFSAPARQPMQGPLAQPTTYTGADPVRPRPNPNQVDIDELPPLRRMRRRIVDGPIPNTAEDSERQSQTPLVDGLGDRERSLSPDDPWEHLLTTMTPDAHLPSTDSSFTSASAAASFASHPASTSTSLATAPTSTLDPFPGCDLLDSDSDASMTEADDDDFDAHEFTHLYDHPDHDYHPRSIPLGASRDRRGLRVPTAAERRQVEHIFREEMRMMMMGPDMPAEWWESEGLPPPRAP